jgi:hypothetical protein
MDYPHMVIVAVAALCIHQLLAAFMAIFDDVPTAHEARAAKSCKHKLTPYKRNLSVTYAWLTTNIKHVSYLDLNAYFKILIGYHSPSWVAVFPSGQSPQGSHRTPQKTSEWCLTCKNIHSKVKFDHYHHLYYCLKWLNDGNF